jgi:flagellar hook protein FlgE
MSFQQGLSGLNAASKNLEVIGNNIANANTYGTKASRAEFADVYAAALNGTGTNAIGIGTTLLSVAQQFTQGNVSTTDNPMDLAINGAGFFQVSDGTSPITYTRNGQFKVDRDGFVVTSLNEKLHGYLADAQGVIQPGQAVPLQLPTGGIAPNETQLASIEMNLDSRSKVTQPTSGPQLIFSDATTYNNATSMTVYDAKGQDIAVSYYFQKAANDQWNVYITANGNSLVGSNAAPLPVTQLQFASDGSRPNFPAGPLAINIASTTNSVGAQTEPINNLMLDLSSATQYGSTYGVTDISQDGYASGRLTAVAVENNGVVMARYSNGQSKPAGQIEVANFRNPQGLMPLGNNLWARTYASGEPVIGTPGDGSLGSLQAGALEESNVDLTGELVSMITAQRIYQANAQTIKTQDQVLQTLVNLR